MINNDPQHEVLHYMLIQLIHITSDIYNLKYQIF